MRKYTIDNMENNSNFNLEDLDFVKELIKTIDNLSEKIEKLEQENEKFDENVKKIIVNLFSFTSHSQQELDKIINGQDEI